jgi:lactate dehydrogenase-like 2-hydroxyacid dehydrogenase
MPPIGVKPTIVLGTPFRARFVTRLAELYTVLEPKGRLTPETLPAGADAAQVLLTVGTIKTDRALIEALPSLGLIACYGTGFEGVDRDATRARGIALSHSPGANSSAVADHSIALMLAAAHRILENDRFVREGRWNVHPVVGLPLVPGLTGRRLGIYGLGMIGRKIATRAAGFEMEVAYHNRARVGDAPYAYYDSLLELAHWADILVIAARAGASNRHAVNAGVLEALGRGGLIVNIARGLVIDEVALIAALQDGLIAAAALDVFEHEPLVPDALRALPNTVLSPHRGGATESAQVNMQAMVLANLHAFFAGQPLVSPVSD